METFDGVKFLINYIYSVITTILSAEIAIGSGILWDSSFKVLTSNKLNELMDTNNILLKELLQKAPGTYQHFLMVANLADIEEDHGTTMVSYFYYTAKEGDPDVSESDFRYTIIKPQSIETAIVMIADSCEAATSSLQNKTLDSIELMVNNIVDEKIKEQQFIECNISFLQIEEIKEEIISNLNSIYHERI